jgi:hypothetical protein
MKAPFIVELVLLALRPFVERADVDNDLSFSIELDVRAIHRPRRRSFEVECLRCRSHCHGTGT